MIELKAIKKSCFFHKALFIMLLLYLPITIGGIIAEKDPNYIITLFAAVFYLYFSVIRFPEMALAVFMAVNYTRMLSPFTGIPMTRIFVGAILLGSAYYIAKSIMAKSVQIRMDTLQLINLLFSCWLAAILFLHTGFAQGYGLHKLWAFLVGSLIPFYAVSIFKNDIVRIERFVYFYVFTLAFTSGISVLFLGHSSHVQHQLSTYGRYSLLTDPINFSVPFVSGVIMLVYLYFRTNSKYFKIAMLVCMSYFFYMIFLSGTRQASVSTILGMMIFLYLMRKRMNPLIPLGILAVVSWFLFSYVQEDVLLTRYLTTWQDPVQEIQGRFIHYQDAFTIFLHSPLIGVGLGEYGRWVGCGDLSAHTHNLFLEILAEEGLVGFFLFLGFLWYPIKKGVYMMRKLDRSDSRFPLGCLFFSIIIAELFRSNFSGGIGSRTILWFAVGALWAVVTSKYQLKNRSNSARSVQ